MGFLDRMRSGLRWAGEKLHIIKREAPKDVRVSISIVEERLAKLEREIAPTKERAIIEREPAIVIPPRRKRYSVSIQYRPVIAGRNYRTRTEIVEAESSLEAIAIVQEGLDEEPDYYLSLSAERTDLDIQNATEK